MLNKINILLFFIIISFASNAQQTVKEGKITYISPELVYVDFESTDGITVGDTLFNKIKNNYNPLLKVKYISKSSLAGENLTTKNIDAGTVVFALVVIKDSTSNADIQNNLQTELVVPVIVEPLTTSTDEFVKKTVSLSKTDGRYSIQSYTNFSNNENKYDYQRWRHSLRFTSQRIAESGFSFSR